MLPGLQSHLELLEDLEWDMGGGSRSGGGGGAGSNASVSDGEGRGGRGFGASLRASGFRVGFDDLDFIPECESYYEKGGERFLLFDGCVVHFSKVDPFKAYASHGAPDDCVRRDANFASLHHLWPFLNATAPTAAADASRGSATGSWWLWTSLLIPGVPARAWSEIQGPHGKRRVLTCADVC
jgi:hypothetical protein